MPVISVSRWQINNRDEAQRIARDLAPTLKQHGAQSVHIGRITTGQHTGQTILSVRYENFEALGRALSQAAQDQQYHQRIDEIRKAGQIHERNIIVLEELS
jgi:hypothetical protein